MHNWKKLPIFATWIAVHSALWRTRFFMWPRLIVRYRTWRGKALDLSRCLDYPTDVLNNESDNAFMFDGVSCGSMESLLHALMEPDELRQRHICLMAGTQAATLPTDHFNGTIWWKGEEMAHESPAFMQLVTRAYEALFVQSPNFQNALMATTGRRLYHSGKVTLLTERQFCGILTDIRLRSHLILSELMEKQGQSAIKAAKGLVGDVMKVVDELFLPQTEHRSFVVRCSADDNLFGHCYYFYIAITPVDDVKLGLWVVRSGVSDGVFRSGTTLVFGTAPIIKKHIASDHFVNAVSNALLENYEKI